MLSLSYIMMGKKHSPSDKVKFMSCLKSLTGRGLLETGLEVMVGDAWIGMPFPRCVDSMYLAR